MRQIKWIVVHCTAGPQAQTTKSIIDYWRNKLRWRTVGYHFLVSGNGSYEQLAPIENPTNGVAGYNASSIHVCYKGGWNGKDTRTSEQKSSLLQIIKNLKKQFPAAKVIGHRDFSPDKNGDGKITPDEWVKLCPCFDAKTEYANA
jgi:N-acetylmuramoyl-L-alanine amidase